MLALLRVGVLGISALDLSLDSAVVFLSIIEERRLRGPIYSIGASSSGTLEVYLEVYLEAFPLRVGAILTI